MEKDTLTDTSTEADAAAATGDDDAELIEEISIDGMCGVY
jgi:mycofactocin precursor